MSVDFTNESVDIWLLLSSDMVTSRKNISSNRDSICLSMEQHLIEKAGYKSDLRPLTTPKQVVSYSKLYFYCVFLSLLFINFSLLSKHPIARGLSHEV